MKVEDIVDPIKPIDALISRVDKEEILRFYRIADFKTTEEFLGQVGRKKGMLGAGGVANFDMAARSVIRDFLNGKLPYFTAPPHFDDVDDDKEDVEME